MAGRQVRVNHRNTEHLQEWSERTGLEFVVLVNQLLERGLTPPPVWLAAMDRSGQTEEEALEEAKRGVLASAS
jgi:hypothetical protein